MMEQVRTAERYEQVPELDRVGLRALTREPTWSRREFLGASLAGAILAAGLTLLGAGSRRVSAMAYSSCSTAGLTYRSNCGTGTYSSTCTKGCARASSVANSSFCIAPSTYQSRHRTCGERVQLDQYSWRNHQIRHDECYGGGFDGWEWTGVDDGSSCSCALQRRFSCNDGVYRIENSVGTPYSGWLPSICVTSKCVNLG